MPQCNLPENSFAKEQKKAIEEFRRGMRDGDLERVIEHFSEMTLLECLRHNQCLSTRLWGSLLGSHFAYDPIQTSEKAWQAVTKRIDAFSLPILLEVDALGISRFSHVIRPVMIKRLTLATKEELERLTSDQRRQLVFFTLEQLRPLITRAPHLEAAQGQAATLGYLALATLKHPGAENPNSRGLPINHVNLGKAIQEYHAALSGTGYAIPP